MKTTKFWIAVIGVIMLASALAAVFFWQNMGGTTARISQDGVCIKTIDLSAVSSPYSFTVEAADGGENLISVEHGRICVSTANCPDQVCVRQGWIANRAAPIACLPNGLVIEIVGESAADEEVDGVTK